MFWRLLDRFCVLFEIMGLKRPMMILLRFGVIIFDLLMRFLDLPVSPKTIIFGCTRILDEILKHFREYFIKSLNIRQMHFWAVFEKTGTEQL